MSASVTTEQSLVEFDNKAKANGFRFVFGVDEAGRGPLAGPVVAAAVFLQDTSFHNRVADSKKLTPAQRERAFAEIQERAFVGTGIVSETVIDEINILRAAHLAMADAVKDLILHLPSDLKESASFSRSVKILIDGNSFTGVVPYAVQTVVAGDARSLSVAAASIVAKVTRDRIIEAYDAIYPQYGFKSHKGYPTSAHRAAIARHGLSPIHRKTFRVS